MWVAMAGLSSFLSVSVSGAKQRLVSLSSPSHSLSRENNIFIRAKPKYPFTGTVSFHIKFLSGSLCSCPISSLLFLSKNLSPLKTHYFKVPASQKCPQKTTGRDSLVVREAVCDEELWAAACLRVRTFYECKQTFGIEFSTNGEDRVVIGTLDLNQAMRLADEITGKRPEGIGADFARAYLSNVCVATELHRKGVGYGLVAKSKKVALEWGITDLYAHVAVDNDAAKRLYHKSGFIYENDEPAWQARFLGRPRRLLLWADLTKTNL
ncbi:uncharacterized protein LOC18435380 isoform X2 [Amborella trichopoda]|uniref:uncharacterized protein LOC18435380 isoform X2 n=1 Tax=Amborella trichopoda TaxID=13333 RepID=UPI0009BFA56F|nr:uncharacterized protein LOC18435380 isoform X2 [Amborella trichopoda]|eukprot:XP_020523719.1 uncharacterized protein LOC18435380 isoform X2 [Amborella trichopoda]